MWDAAPGGHPGQAAQDTVLPHPIWTQRHSRAGCHVRLGRRLFGRIGHPTAMLYKKVSRRTVIGFPAVLFITVYSAPMRKPCFQIQAGGKLELIAFPIPVKPNTDHNPNSRYCHTSIIQKSPVFTMKFI